VNRKLERGQATRQELVDAATRLFASQGYEDTSIEAVLQETGSAAAPSITISRARRLSSRRCSSSSDQLRSHDRLLVEACMIRPRRSAGAPAHS